MILPGVSDIASDLAW